MMTETDFALIESTIAETEKKTSAEFVVCVQKSSADYGWVHWVWGCMASLAASVILMLVTRNSGWTTRMSDLIQWQCLGFFVGSVLPYLPQLKRRTVPNKWCATTVTKAAAVEFVRQGLTENSNRLGILIYVSVLERRVEILADRGITSVVPSPEQAMLWKTHSDRIADGFRNHRETQALCEELRILGDFFSDKLPPTPGSKNQLSNQVRN